MSARGSSIAAESGARLSVTASSETAGDDVDLFFAAGDFLHGGMRGCPWLPLLCYLSLRVAVDPWPMAEGSSCLATLAFPLDFRSAACTRWQTGYLGHCPRRGLSPWLLVAEDAASASLLRSPMERLLHLGKIPGW